MSEDPTSAAVESEKRTALVAGEEMRFRLTAKNALTRSGFSVSEADTPGAALAIVERERPAVVVATKSIRKDLGELESEGYEPYVIAVQDDLSLGMLGPMISQQLRAWAV